MDKAYLGFKKLEQKVAASGKVADPGAVAATIGREKYGKASFQAAATSGKAAVNPPKASKKTTVKSQGEEETEKAYLGQLKIGKDGAKFDGSGVMPAGTKAGGQEVVGDKVMDKVMGKEGEGSKIQSKFTPKVPSGAPAHLPNQTHATTSGGGNTNFSGPSVATSAGVSKPEFATVKNKSLKKGSDERESKILHHQRMSSKHAAANSKTKDPFVSAKHEEAVRLHDVAMEAHDAGYANRQKASAKADAFSSKLFRTPTGSGVSKALDELTEISKAVTSRSVPRMPRALAQSLDTWRSATSVLTTGNSRYAGTIQPYQAEGSPLHSTPVEVMKSNYVSCGGCGRTFMQKSFPDGCPTCLISKAHQCVKGHSMTKGHDGNYRCSVCG
jgi:hypothetical protein